MGAEKKRLTSELCKMRSCLIQCRKRLFGSDEPGAERGQFLNGFLPLFRVQCFDGVDAPVTRAARAEAIHSPQDARNIPSSRRT